MHRLIKLYSLATVVLVFGGMMISCEEQDNRYQGPPVVEFQRSITGVSTDYTVGDGAVVDTAVVQLVGPHQTSDMNLTFAVENTSTAVEGTHYNLLTTGTFVLPAGSSFGYIRFEVLTDNAAAGESFSIDFTLTGGDLGVSENYKTLTHEMEFE